MTDPFLQSLHDWQNFYTLLGGASATLTGLMFVAASLGTQLINDADDPKVRTFVTPTVIHFSLVLLLSALMNVPSQTRAALAAQFAAVGLIGAGYSLSHLPRLRFFHQKGGLETREWTWNLFQPFLASLCLLGAAYGLRQSFSWSLDMAAAGTVLLVMAGIRNAWNTTLYPARATPS